MKKRVKSQMKSGDYMIEMSGEKSDEKSDEVE